MLLSRPMRLPQHRVLALIQLVRVLSRYERFDDAVEVADVVLEHPMTDPATRFAVGCGRAMALLRAGRLFDAGQAITTLRREVGRIDDALRRADGQRPEADDPASRETVEEGEEAAALDSVLASEGTSAEEMPRPPFDSAALTMVEMYRDIQTRHSDEALAMLEEKRPALREALGVRLGDALGLAALASHRQPDVDRARRYWSEATCLTPEVELLRRYPELAEVAGAYPATALPVDGTGGAA